MYNILYNEERMISLALYMNIQKYELRFYLLPHFELLQFRMTHPLTIGNPNWDRAKHLFVSHLFYNIIRLE